MKKNVSAQEEKESVGVGVTFKREKTGFFTVKRVSEGCPNAGLIKPVADLFFGGTHLSCLLLTRQGDTLFEVSGVSLFQRSYNALSRYMLGPPVGNFCCAHPLKSHTLCQ